MIGLGRLSMPDQFHYDALLGSPAFAGAALRDIPDAPQRGVPLRIYRLLLWSDPGLLDQVAHNPVFRMQQIGTSVQALTSERTACQIL